MDSLSGRVVTHLTSMGIHTEPHAYTPGQIVDRELWPPL